VLTDYISLPIGVNIERSSSPARSNDRQFTTGLVGSLFDLVRGGGKNLTPDVAASLAIARQAMSNVPEITDDVARGLQLGPAQSRIARDTFGGSGTARGGLIGTTNIAPVARQAPVPEFAVGPGSPTRGFRGSSPGDVAANVPVREQVRPTSMPRSVRPGAAQPQAPRPDFVPGGAAGVRPTVIAPNGRVPGNVAPRPEFPNDITPPSSEVALSSRVPQQGPPTMRPTGTTANSTQGRLDLRNPAGSTAQQPYTTSRGVERPAGGSIGGQMYNPQAAASPSASRQIDSMARDGGRLMDRVDSPSYLNRIPDGQGNLFGRNIDTSNPLAGLVDETFQVPAALRNVRPTAEGSFLTDLSDPRVLAALGVSGAVGMGGGLYGISQGQADRVQGEMPMSGASDSVTAVAPSPNTLSQTPAVDTSQGGLTAADLLLLEQAGKGITTGETAITSSVQQEMQTPSNVRPFSQGGSVISNNGADERRRQTNQQYGGIDGVIDKYTEPMSPEKYSNIGDYYRDRDNYASQTARKALIAAAVSELSGLQEEANTQWAMSNPGLAYELQRQALSAPQMNQQTPSSFAGVEAVSDLGSNAVEAAYTGANNIGNPDLEVVTRPRQQPTLTNLPESIQRRLSNQGYLR